MKKIALLFSLLILNPLFAQVQLGGDIVGAALGDEAAYSVSMSDPTTVAIGSPKNDSNATAAGQVRVFTLKNGSWSQKGNDILGNGSDQWAGSTVVMPDSNTVAIGLPKNSSNATRSGAVRVYQWNGSSWVQKGSDLYGIANYDEIGKSISMPNSNTLAISSPRLDQSIIPHRPGYVKVYNWNGSSWGQRGNTIIGQHDSIVGYSISMPDPNTIATGGIWNKIPTSGIYAGSVQIFKYNGTSWVRKGSVIPGTFHGDKCGASVSMPNSNLVAVGSPGSSQNSGLARVFEWTSGNWVQKGNDITGNNGSFGFSIDMPSDNLMIVGAPTSSSAGYTESGSANIFIHNGTQWVQKGVNIVGTAAYNKAGFSVTISDSSAIAVGMPGYNSNTGLCRVYSIEPCSRISNLNGVTDTNKVTIMWDNTPSFNQFLVEYDTAGFYPGSGNFLTVSNDSIVISGLQANTEYEFYVRATCSSFPNTKKLRLKTYCNNYPSDLLTIVGDTITCEEPVILKAQPGYFSYNWSNGTSADSVIISNLGFDTVSVSISDQDGCTSTSRSIPIRIKPINLATISYFDSLEVCYGDSIIFTAPPGTGLSYTWSNGSSDTSIIVYQTDSVNLIVTNSFGCSDTSSYLNATFNPNPTSIITYYGDTIACEGESIVLIGPQGQYTYQWSDGSTNDSLIINQVGNYSNQLIVTNSFGCVDTSAVINSQISPKTNAHITSSTNPVCYGDSIVFTAPLGQNLSYQWSNGSTDTSVVFFQTDSVSLKLTNGFGCIDSSTMKIATINSIPNSYISVVGDSAVCFGDSIVLKGTPGQYSYQWSNGSILDSVIISSVGIQYNTLIISDSIGCTDTSDIQITIVNDNPSIQISVLGNSQVCYGDSILLVPSTTTLVDSVHWFNSSSATSLSQNDSLYVKVSDSYFAIGTSSAGCTNFSNTLNISIDPINITANIVNATCSNTSDGIVNLFVAGGYPPYSFLWNTGDTLQSLFGLTANTNVTAIVTDNIGCSKSIANTIGYNHLFQQVSILGADAPLCYGESDTLYLNIPFNSVIWGGQGSGSTDSIVVGPGQSHVSILDTNNCPSSDTVVIASKAPYTIDPEICMITSENSRNKIIWERSSKKGVGSYNVYREDLLGFTLIGSKGVNLTSEFLDLSVNSNTKSYKYYLTLVDSCGIEHGDVNKAHETIHLQANQGTVNEVNLSWNSYVGTSLLYYVIYRKNPGTSSFLALDSVNTSTTTFTDFNAATGTTQYQIAGVLPNPCSSSNKTNSRIRSNILQEQTIEINENNDRFLKIYPNPTTGVVKIEAATNRKIDSIFLTDQYGNSWDIQIVQNQLNLNGIAAGFYFIEVLFDDGNSIKSKISLIN